MTLDATRTRPRILERVPARPLHNAGALLQHQSQSLVVVDGVQHLQKLMHQGGERHLPKLPRADGVHRRLRLLRVGGALRRLQKVEPVGGELPLP